MSSPKVAPSTHRDNWDASPENRRIRHGRRDLSPVPPPPAVSLGETRRVFLKRKHDDLPTDNAFAARTMQEFLRTESAKDDHYSPTAAKRPKSSVIVVPKPSVDRSNICPILVRVFYTTDGRHTPSSAFTDGKCPSNEVQINTWMNISLKELSQDIVFAAKSRSVERKRQPQLKISQPIRLHYSSVFPDNSSRGKYRKRDLGFCIINEFADGEVEAKISPDDGDATLESKKFQIGDFLDVAISNVGERRVEDGNRFRKELDKKDAGRF
ncbi:unnamed protein product [Hymenolepis diminuta]|uniref:18 kDa Sin3-associated polypeptide n=1 Tax=Hymenolepis diminuta TaxID=6216 RepID=A0A0R3SSZ0_HYMDI|nr:unnamed protein product [Hymenolepis diminuta]VUZ39354.1 unnamed protein product [Hymenolepis diminuta]